MNENYYLTSEASKSLQKWYQGLDSSRGDRARLRRAERPEDILFTNAFFNFIQQMPEDFPEKTAYSQRMFVKAAIAGIVSHVKENETSGRFAQQLATAVKGQKAAMSETRFQQLQKSRTTDDFYRRMIRAVRLLNGRVNIVSLANDIIHWHKEYNQPFDREPANRLAVRWATDYYTTLQTA